MSVNVKKFAKITASALGAAALAAPAFAPVAQEDAEAAHAEVAPLTEVEVEASRTLFSQYGCGSCHALADANGYGSIGPSLDGNDTLTVDYVNTIITNGQGAMPSFGGMVGEEDLEKLSRYIVEYKAD
ncbi:c-type cytochrome [Aurantiacibacter poecillastricola]|uniref:c-type cytochrome n=1 Tax=Aurantiacibacter poecillastricola TaxID=3064385 RepID=UPI00273E1AA2|nr:cytochrome c [Aurantiacibacter sp. 219JJ12-13]MDP5262442.1 cytochrome c [Aurantiacibacter sp. 219JJ12-13]